RIQVEVLNMGISSREEGLVLTLTSPKAVAVALPWNRRHVLLFAPTAALAFDAADMPAQTVTVMDARASIVLDDRQEPLRLAVMAAGFEMADAEGGERLSVAKPQLHWRAASAMEAE